MKILMAGKKQDILIKREELLTELFPDSESISFLDPLLAVKYCVDHRVDMVISDFSLPMIDGIQMIKLLRSQNRLVLPILIEEEERHGSDAEKLGIGYLTEPVTADELRAVYELLRDGEE